jgi:hypothetical protein
VILGTEAPFWKKIRPSGRLCPRNGTIKRKDLETEMRMLNSYPHENFPKKTAKRVSGTMQYSIAANDTSNERENSLDFRDDNWTQKTFLTKIRSKQWRITWSKADWNTSEKDPVIKKQNRYWQQDPITGSTFPSYSITDQVIEKEKSTQLIAPKCI